jgi:para-aminobenzoate synthetase component I
MFIKTLPYQANCENYFSKIRHLPLPVWLDSGQPYITSERFDILTAEPDIQIYINDSQTMIQKHNETSISSQNGLELLFKTLSEINIKNTHKLAEEDLPFYGGAIGFLSYDYGRKLEKISSYSKNDISFPCLFFGIYPWAFIADHQKKIGYFVSYLAPDKALEKFDQIKTLLLEESPMIEEKFQLTTSFCSNMSFEAYKKKFIQIMAHIRDGDCYQVNFAQRFSANFLGDSYLAYLKLRKKNPAPLSAYFKTPYGNILSCSPERFIAIRNRKLATQPIKGTRPRGKTIEEDVCFAQNLLNSQKDHAENTMIVDLMRNDLSKVCLAHTVCVPELCALKSFSNVHHLVSTIQGELKPTLHATDVLAATFPGGSITGAPKISAMNIIDKLEPHRRNIYCGSLLYIDIRGNMDSNIAIRTLLDNNQSLYVYGGGGIVADSDVESEYTESLTKVMNIFEILGNAHAVS